jgi:uncharacterized membrane protein YhhN
VTARLAHPDDRRRLLLAFTPYLVVSVVHVVGLAFGFDDVARASKLLLMPALALAVVLTARPLRAAVPVLLLVAIAFSWIGDGALTVAGDLWFLIGLTAFLLAHVTYVVLFLRMRGRTRLPAWTTVFVIWYAAFLTLLGPDLGALFAPVAAYGLVLGVMAALAGGLGGAIAVGGALFVVSDSVLALGRFLPGYDFAPHDVVVMSTYLAAQGLIASGVVQAHLCALSSASEAGPGGPTASRELPSTGTGPTAASMEPSAPAARRRPCRPSLGRVR